MSDRLLKKTELVANLAIIIVAILLGGVLVKRYLLTNNIAFDERKADLSIPIGTKVSLPEVDWTKNSRTLLLVLSKDCRFCSESAQFYQRLAREMEGGADIRLVAVLPQEISEGKKYLSDLGVSVNEIKQSSLGSLGVAGTPTLILVNNTGEVVGSWVGRLSPDGETEVLNLLKGNKAT